MKIHNIIILNFMNLSFADTLYFKKENILEIILGLHRSYKSLQREIQICCELNNLTFNELIVILEIKKGFKRKIDIANKVLLKKQNLNLILKDLQVKNVLKLENKNILITKNGEELIHRVFVMNDKHILLVEDDETLQALIEKLLVNNDYVVSKAINIEEAKKLVKLFLFDLIILDVMLPDSTGLDFYENTIKNRVNTPVIFLSALSNVDDRVTGLELGADDYIGKPFDSRELLLKIEKNILKKQSLDVINFGNNTEFDLKKEQLLFKKQNINLSSNEVKILKLLINNSHQYLTRDLLNTELGLDYLSRSGDMQISRLRLKLKKECNLEDIIRSVHGKGYKIFI